MSLLPNPPQKKPDYLLDIQFIREAWPRLHLSARFYLAVRVWWHTALLAAVLRWYFYALARLAGHLLTFRTWRYPAKLVTLYTLTFLGTVIYSPVPLRSPTPVLFVVYLGELVLVYLFGHWLYRWASTGFARA